MEVVSRVEAADGTILTLDHGALTNGNATQTLSATMLGAVNEYQRAVTAERTQEAKERAVMRGVPPFPKVPPGYRRAEGNGPLEPDPTKAPAVTEAFHLRAEGATINEVRAFLRRRGIERSFHGVQAMLGSRVYVGELRFGKIVNPSSHPALVGATTFARVQKVRSPRGPRPKSERLLARLGVLRCASCGARLVIGARTADTKRYEFYRCPPVGDCQQRVTISADVAEEIVSEATRKLLAGMKGRASADKGVSVAVRDLEARQKELDSAMRLILGAGLESEETARERLTELREARDAAAERVEELRDLTAVSLAIDPTRDWDSFTLEERRALIRAVISSATVAPGKGPDRITVEAREDFSL